MRFSNAGTTGWAGNRVYPRPASDDQCIKEVKHTVFMTARNIGHFHHTQNGLNLQKTAILTKKACLQPGF
jgi:hypothetical protein